MCTLVQRFEPQGRRFTNFHYYYYQGAGRNQSIVKDEVMPPPRRPACFRCDAARVSRPQGVDGGDAGDGQAGDHWGRAGPPRTGPAGPDQGVSG